MNEHRTTTEAGDKQPLPWEEAASDAPARREASRDTPPPSHSAQPSSSSPSSQSPPPPQPPPSPHMSSAESHHSPSPPRRATSRALLILIAFLVLAVLSLAGLGAYLWYVAGNPFTRGGLSGLASPSTPLTSPADVASDAHDARQPGTWQESSAQLRAAQNHAATERAQLTTAVHDVQSAQVGLHSDAQQTQNDVRALHTSLASLQQQWQAQQFILLLAQVEQSVQFATQHLRIAGDVTAATSALQRAQSRLQESPDAQFPTLRRLLDDEITRLQSTAGFDRAALALQLGNLAQRVVDLPPKNINTPAPAGQSSDVASDTTSDATARNTTETNASAEDNDTTPPASDDTAPETSAWTSVAKRTWDNLGASIDHLLDNVVRIQELDTPPNPLVLSPSQHYFVRGNVQLLLLGAQQALLADSREVVVQNLNQCISLLSLYFDVDNSDVLDVLQQTEATMKTVRTAPLHAPLSSLLAEVHRLQVQNTL